MRKNRSRNNNRNKATNSSETIISPKVVIWKPSELKVEGQEVEQVYGKLVHNLERATTKDDRIAAVEELQNFSTCVLTYNINHSEFKEGSKLMAPLVHSESPIYPTPDDLEGTKLKLQQDVDKLLEFKIELQHCIQKLNKERHTINSSETIKSLMEENAKSSELIDKLLHELAESKKQKPPKVPANLSKAFGSMNLIAKPEANCRNESLNASKSENSLNIEFSQGYGPDNSLLDESFSDLKVTQRLKEFAKSAQTLTETPKFASSVTKSEVLNDIVNVQKSMVVPSIHDLPYNSTTPNKSRLNLFIIDVNIDQIRSCAPVKIGNFVFQLKVNCSGGKVNSWICCQPYYPKPRMIVNKNWHCKAMISKMFKHPSSMPDLVVNLEADFCAKKCIDTSLCSEIQKLVEGGFLMNGGKTLEVSAYVEIIT